MAAFSKCIDTITLTVGHRGLSRTNVDSLSILHYREPVAGDGTPRFGSGGMDYAELGILYRNESTGSQQGVSRNELQCKLNTDTDGGYC